ncbi:MAG: 5-formyltetrahydrofolate cyclo-ligase [Candidatus Omnitrophica bacterium]|nr:5-formyltetrahydrofolate cyclo-ligase [Candidatus Omnitrophota bacterium]
MNTPMTVKAGLTKRQIRIKIVSKLRKQKEEERLRKSEKILTKLFRLEKIKKAKTIMFYLDFDGEVKTAEMIKKALMMGKEIAVPVCSVKERQILPCKMGLETTLKKGPYGINEPLKKEFVPLSKLDVVIVPGMAFDRQGNRLGRGKGYYDRFLKRLPKKTYRIGLAFDFQILPSISFSSQDERVDKVVFA